MNDDKQALYKQESAPYCNRRQDVFVMALFASQEALQDPGNPLGIN